MPTYSGIVLTVSTVHSESYSLISHHVINNGLKKRNLKTAT